MSIGQRIKDVRTAKGLNQDQIAERSGISQGHLSAVENGEHQPTYGTLEKIAKAMGMEVSELVATSNNDDKPNASGPESNATNLGTHEGGER